MRLTKHCSKAVAIGALVSLLAFMPLSPAGADDIDDYEGEWHATSVSATQGTPPDVASPTALSLMIDEQWDGFLATWTIVDANGTWRSITHDFDEHDNDGVFEATNEDPMRDDPLIWARIDDDVLVLYSLEIDRQGKQKLQAWRLATQDDGSLRASIEFVFGPDVPSVLTVRFEPGSN